MKIRERIEYDELTDTLHTITTHDAQPVLDSVARLKQVETPKFAEKRHVARVPFPLVEAWIQEAGVRFDDYEAVREVVDRKIMSGEFNKLRPWTGTY